MANFRTTLTRCRVLVAAGLILSALTVALSGAAPTTASAAVAAVPNSILGYGSAANIGGNETGLPGPIVGIAAEPDGNGYWVATSSGQVTSEGGAKNFGSTSASLNSPIIGIAATPSGDGYWLVASDGGIFTFGDAHYYGSTGGMPLNKPIVGMASTSDGRGYWLVASDGGIFTFGDAVFHGSTGAVALNQPVVGMAPTPSGDGYWLVASDGGIFTFGDATFHGSMGGTQLVEPVVGMTASTDGGGYRMVASDGGIFSFGDASFFGSASGAPLTSPVVGMAPRAGGYWIAFSATSSLNTLLGQEEVLSGLNYSPLSWSPMGFQWRWAPPAQLAALWAPGQEDAISRGDIMAFEAIVGLPINGSISNAEMSALQTAAADPTGPYANPSGFTYSLATETNPETLTVWHNGQVVEKTLSNTGGAGTPTAQGSFPVYLRYRNQIMRGTNPNGSTYADPVQYVAYFNGSDAIHYFPRASYGYPQSLGCVELPLGPAAIVWPYTTIGSIVTVD